MAKFKCRYCGGESSIQWTKPHFEAEWVERKYKCDSCGKLFITKEIFERATEQTIRDLGQTVTTRKRSCYQEETDEATQQMRNYMNTKRQAAEAYRVSIKNARTPDKPIQVQVTTTLDVDELTDKRISEMLGKPGMDWNGLGGK